MGAHLDRRGFVLGSLALPAVSRGGRVRPPAAARTLVLIQLTGGNDGLSTLVPYGDDVYGRARKETRLAASEVHRLDGRVGLHPRLTKLRALHDGGHLAWFEGVGYPEPNRSHFRSLDIWHAADARGRGVGAGWVARALGRLAACPAHALVHFGPRPPFALNGGERAPLALTPALLTVAGQGSEEAAPAADEASSWVAERLDEARASLLHLRRALERPRPAPAYPSGPFGLDLRHAAALVHAELGVRVLSVELDGFDTHRDQRARHGRLMETLDAGLSALAEDLASSEAGRETLVFLYSEFGRRVAENASGGTDHGAAGLALAFGHRVRGGLHGVPADLRRLQDGDLAFTTDFRGLYARILAHVFGLDARDVLGGSFEGPDFV